MLFFLEGHCGNEMINVLNQQGGRSWDRQREVTHQHPSNSLMMMNNMQQDQSQYVLQFPYVTQISSSPSTTEQGLVKEDKRSNNNSDNTTIAPPFIDFLGVGAT